MSAQNWIVL